MKTDDKKKKSRGVPSPDKLVKDNPLYAKLLSFEPRRRDLRRALIVESAIQCIHKYGIEETHFESIGKLSKMGRAHVKYYFKNRDDIVRAAIEFVATTAQMVTLEYISRAKNAKERLEAYVEGSFRWAEKFPEHLPVLGLNYYYCSFREPYKKLHTEIRRLGEERAVSLVHDAYPALPAEKAKFLGQTIQNLILGNLLDWGTTKKSEGLEVIHDRTKKAVALLLTT